MAAAQARKGLSFPFRSLGRKLSSRERSSIERFLRSIVHFEAELGRFPRPPRGLPAATPFVSVYARGRLRGCFGSTEGLARAALGALFDARFGSIRASERSALDLEVSFPSGARAVEISDFEREIDLGTEGVAYVRPEGVTLFLANVARDEGMDAARLLHALSEKARAPIDRSGRLYLFSQQSVVVRSKEYRRTRTKPIDLAARWLAERVKSDGRVEFGCDPRARKRYLEGPFLHGRSALVILALAAEGGHRAATERARRWLEREIGRTSAGKTVPGFPTDPAEIAGTLALAELAGVDTRAELTRLASDRRVLENPWHAAQVALVLGAATPPKLWRACVRDLDAHPWAPWTAMAARALDDQKALARVERALIDSIRKSAPYAGAANVRAVPELALTAIAIEALAPSRNGRAQRAVERGRRHLLQHQFRGEATPAALDPKLAEGAFPVSPIMPALRSDVTAHALLALSVGLAIPVLHRANRRE